MANAVLLVDDHPVMRAGLAMMLEHAPEFSLAGEAGTTSEAMAAMAELRPGLVVLDLLLGGRDGVPLIGELLALTPRHASSSIPRSTKPSMPGARCGPAHRATS